MQLIVPWTSVPAGQQNVNQRIQHHQRTKDENVRLAGQLRALQEEQLKLSSRQARLWSVPA